MANKFKLFKMDELALCNHLDLDVNDSCFYWRLYTANKNYDYSETNQLIHNLKIPTKDKNDRLYYKEKAITQIAKEFTHLIHHDDIYKNYTFIPIPPSRTINHSHYDDRLIKTLSKISQLKKINMDVRNLVIQCADVKAAHESKKHERLTKENLLQIYKIDENLLKPEINKIVVFDDVITKGTHFKVIQQLLKHYLPKTPIIGLFIARSIYTDEL